MEDMLDVAMQGGDVDDDFEARSSSQDEDDGGSDEGPVQAEGSSKRAVDSTAGSEQHQLKTARLV